MAHQSKRELGRQRRQNRVRRKIRGTDERPRLCVYRSLRYTYAQLISDESGSVLGSVTTKGMDLGGVTASSKEGAKVLGQKLAVIAKEKNISNVVFDRNGYVYHGRVAAVAEGAREGGLAF
ncbi:MAG: 50S ribosomal protein L18 [Bdellovibrionales bacterium]|nr:50S ribosomal protein L18 [Bdellovibrionales bacterium]